MSTQSLSESRPLAGKTALVTGASRGIGAAIARDLARAGAHVLVNYARSESPARALVDEITRAGGRASLLPGDVSKPADVATMFATVDRDHAARVDVLVNNAGIYRVGSFLDVSDEDYDASFDTNVRAVFQVTRHAVKRMPRGGRVITIGSVIGERAIAPGMTVYATTKFAAAGLARALAHDLAPLGITSNLVQPGPIDTDMNPASPDKNPHADSLKQSIPLKRYGEPSEIAAAVTFLASPAASFINGATLNVDGGVNA